MSFDENATPRDTGGRFTEKAGAAPDESVTSSLLTVSVTDAARYCAECGDEMSVGANGVSHHITDGEVDHDKDADHVAIDDDEYRDQHNDYKETGDVLFVTDDGYEIQEATDGYAAYDADGNFITSIATASDDHDSIEDAFREQMAELKVAGG